jgi:hypothetical protein
MCFAFMLRATVPDYFNVCRFCRSPVKNTCREHLLFARDQKQKLDVRKRQALSDWMILNNEQ